MKITKDTTEYRRSWLNGFNKAKETEALRVAQQKEDAIAWFLAREIDCNCKEGRLCDFHKEFIKDIFGAK